MRTARIALVGVLALAVACASFNGLEPPEAYVVSLEPIEGEAFEQRFEVGLRLVNPNDRELAIDGLEFTLDVNGARLTRGVTNQAVRIPRLSEGLVSVTATTSMFDLLRQLVAASNASEWEYELRGRVFLAGSPRSLAFTRTGTFESAFE